MVAKLSFLTGWVALQAIGAIEHIAGNAIMLRMHARLFVLVAGNTGKHSLITCLGMAARTIIPGVVVSA